MITKVTVTVSHETLIAAQIAAKSLLEQYQENLRDVQGKNAQYPDSHFESAIEYWANRCEQQLKACWELDTAEREYHYE